MVPPLACAAKLHVAKPLSLPQCLKWLFQLVKVKVTPSSVLDSLGARLVLHGVAACKQTCKIFPACNCANSSPAVDPLTLSDLRPSLLDP